MADGVLSPYLQIHFRRLNDPDYTGLCVAENHQVFDLIEPKLTTVPPLSAEVAGYGNMAGRRQLREAVAGMFTDHIVGRPVDPDTVQLLAGSSAVLDALGHALGDPGDGVLIPTPSYAGFWPDLQTRPGLTVVPVPTDPAGGFRLTPPLLQQAWDTACVPIRFLLLTNPDNPRGQVMATEDLEAVLAWAEDKAIHVVADEVYALSVFGSDPFVSVGRLRPTLGDRLHLVWAFSKDFGISGLRCGVLISENESLRRTIDLQALWGGVSAHTQHVLAAMLEDQHWVEAYLAEMRRRLAGSATETSRALDDAGIEHLHPTAGFFVLCDLRQALDEQDWDAEQRLWSRVLQATGVNLTPGEACRSPVPGFFRLCYAATSRDRVAAAVRAVAAHLDDG